MKVKSPRHVGMKRDKKSIWLLMKTINSQDDFHKIPFHRKKQLVK